MSSLTFVAGDRQYRLGTDFNGGSKSSSPADIAFTVLNGCGIPAGTTPSTSSRFAALVEWA